MIRLASSAIVLESQVFSHSDVTNDNYWDIYYNHNLGMEPDNVNVWILINGYWHKRFDFVWWTDAGNGARFYGWDLVTSDSTYNTAHVRIFRAATGGTVYIKVKVHKTL